MNAVETARYVDSGTPDGIERFLEDLLDEMALTDREYHHLDLSIPLTAAIIGAVLRSGQRHEKVLLVGGTSLLAEALLRLDVELEIWRLPHSMLSAASETRVSRQVTPDCLSDVEFAHGSYGLVILPFVVESIADSARVFLRRVRDSLQDGGQIVLATRNQARMDSRLAALVGRPAPQRRAAGSMSLSWPAQATQTEYHKHELVELARGAALRVERCSFVDGARLFLELEPMTIESYTARKLGQAARRLQPSMRDTILFQLVPRPGDDGPLESTPHVTAAVSAVSGGERLRQALAALEEQTYPRDRYDVIVLHDGRDDGVHAIVDAVRLKSTISIRELVEQATEGAMSRNQALRETRAAIVGHTDDSCILPADWIEAAVLRFDEDTAAVTGPVFAGPDSHPKYMDVPGTRPDPAERERWRTDLFPISNVFYRSSAARAIGGFNEGFGFGSGTNAAFGWDGDLAWRLHRAGWRVRFCETLAISTVFRGPASAPALANVRRAEELVGAYDAVPSSRLELVANVFASRQTMYFDALLLGAGLAVLRRNRVWLLLSIPWFSQVSRRVGLWPPRKWLPSGTVVAKIGGLHLLWFAGFIKGSIRSRRIVL